MNSPNELLILNLEASEQERLRRLYEYLLSKTDLGTGTKSPARRAKAKVGEQSEIFNESFIAYQWGMEDYRIFVRRVLRTIYPERYTHEKSSLKSDNKSIPGLDLYKLVKILHSLERYHSPDRDKKYRGGDQDDDIQPKFTAIDKVEALRLYGELSEFERDCLKLPVSSADKLIVHLNKFFHDASLDISEDLVRQIYKLIIDKSLLPSSVIKKSESDLPSDIDQLIKKEIEKLLRINFYWENPEKIEREIQDKYLVVKRELERMSFQCGTQQVSKFSDFNTPGLHINKLPSSALIIRLTRSIFENDILTKKLPIFIKFITVERIRPLPLRVHKYEESSKPSDTYLNQDFDGLLDDNLVSDENKIEIEGFARQIAFRVRVHFYIRSMNASESELEFYQDIMGIGSPISLSIAAIDRVLLWDIPCLRAKNKNIFPVAKQIFHKEEILDHDNNSCIWSHSVVQLCHNTKIEKVLKSEKFRYEKVDIYGDMGTGNFCGFDLLETVVKSALIARLDAILKLGVNSKNYLLDIRKKIEESKVSRLAKKRFTSYPFSFWAMKGILDKGLLYKYRERNENSEFIEKVKGKPWSLVAYDAHLSLTEILLIEGKHCDAKYYLDTITVHVEKTECIIGDLMKARYYYLMAQYHYLYDLEKLDNSSDKLHEDRYLAIKAVTESLREAYRHLDRRIKTCNIIDELTHTNVHPLFSLLGKIHFLKARLHLAFSAYVDNSISRAANLKKVLTNLQEARICAARDGDCDEYVCYTSFQSWIYSMMAFLDEKDFSEPCLQHLNKQKCLDWSRRLLDHSMNCYREKGLKNYHSLKYHAGRSEKSEESNINKIDIIPFIQEHQNGLDSDHKNSFKHIHIPYFSNLIQLPNKYTSFKKGFENYENELNVYLFGSQSCAILFASAIEKLTRICNEEILDEVIEIIEESLKYSIAAWAIAKAGGVSHPCENEIHKEQRRIVRDFDTAEFDEYGISVIKGLYPHRTSYVVALSSLSITLCGILLLMKSYPDYLKGHIEWEQLNNKYPKFNKMSKELLDDVYEKNGKKKSDQTFKMSQPRFNGHIEVHLSRIVLYYGDIIKALENKTWDSDRLCLSNMNEAYSQWRDRLMRDLLRLIMGEPVETIAETVTDHK